MSETVEFRAALREALDEELAADSSVVLFGEDVAAAGGVFAVTTGLFEKYGPERVFDTPISELAMTGAAFGAAVSGMRPVLEIMFGDFLALSMDSLINQASKYWFLTGGRQSARLGQGPTQVGDPRPQPGALLRAQAPLLQEGAGQRRRARAAGGRRGAARGLRRDAGECDEGR